ncbi:MAG TPA: glycosyl transferase family 2 [Lachnoclostridium sp.]|uniref:glycosyltransferase family 2 protein n=1 Tax=Lacrimispora sp. TaxID=2719234 RepID=UPI000EF0A78C|nr:glycosyltransferase family 2 protein [Lacrimispora sp.]HCD44788.1 glycosyl transferase family 2 [Lachnoclostridium sp.]
MEEKMQEKTVDVIIPVYKPDEKLKLLLRRLGKQSYPIRRIIIMNTERSYWKEEEYSWVPNLEVHHVTKEEFDHGGTRNQGAGYSEADIMVFMTDDAVPADGNLIGALVRSFDQTGKGKEKVVMAYGRQLPNSDCALAEQYTRSFNYSEQSRVKTGGDLKELGIKTFFASNVCCAYDRAAFLEAGGFISRTIFNEDMIYAGNAVRHRGQAVAYEAGAKVYHSHNYGCIAQFKRNFDLAVSQADHPEVFEGIRSEGEGIRLVKKTCAWLVKERKPWLVPGVIVKSGFKYMGYLMGKRYRSLPKRLVLSFTMNREYWKKER